MDTKSMKEQRESAHWFTGPEVEGRLTGVPTCFVNTPNSGYPLDFPHYYFDRPCLAHVYDIRALLDRGRLVTLCFHREIGHDFSPRLLSQCHVVVALETDSLTRMKPTDEYRIGAERDFFNGSLSSAQLLFTRPVDYGKDVFTA